MIKYYMSKAIKKLKLSEIRESKIDPKAYISGGNTVICSQLGRYTYTGYNTQIIYAKIGAFCSISGDCKIGGGEHPINWVSTSPLFHNVTNVFHKHFSEHDFKPYKNVEIGNDVWIGQNVLIKGGVTIGDGAIIGMGSVVTKDVGAYEIWCGNPARCIKKRFSDEIIEKMEHMQWWTWDEKKIKQYGEKFADIEEFCKLCGEI